MKPRAGNLFFIYGLLPILLIMLSCAPGLKTAVHSPSLSQESLSESSPFYDIIAGCYKLKFIEDNSTILADLKNDSTIRFIIPGSSREYFNGIWYLSDSLLLIDIIDAGGRDCLTGELFEAHDTADLIRMKWKLDEITPDGFRCNYKKKKFSKKSRIFAVKSDNCKDFLSK